MSRPLDPDMTTALTASAVRPFFLADFTFDSETLRLWSGYGDLCAPTGNSVITNGDYTDGLNNWTVVSLGTGTVTAANDTAILTAGTGFSNRVFIHQTFNTVAGQKYAIKLNHTGVKLRVRVRNALNNSDILPLTYYEAGDDEIIFTAASNRTNLHLRNQVGGVITIQRAEVYVSQDYTGAGDLLTLSGFEESSDLSAQGVTATLSGMNSDIVQKARDDNYQGNPVRIRLGTLNSSGDVITNPVDVLNGFMDVMSIQDEGSSCTVTLAVENKLIRLERSNVRRYTSEDQKVEHPTDKGFEFVTKIQEVEVNWGKGTVSSLGGRGNKVRNGRETEH